MTRPLLVMILFSLTVLQLKMGVSQTTRARVPVALRSLAGTNGWNIDDIQSFFLTCAENEEVKNIYMTNIKMTEVEFGNFCGCLTEKYVKNHHRVGNTISGVTQEIGERYGAECTVANEVIIKGQSRSGNFKKPGHDGLVYEKYPELKSLINLNGFTEGFVYNGYETCLNNSALKYEFGESGYGEDEYIQYCKCLINEIVHKEKYENLLTLEFQQRLEGYGINCVNSLD